MNRTADITNYALIATGVVGVATIATYLLWPAKQSSAAQRNGLVVAPWLTPSSQGVAAAFAF